MSDQAPVSREVREALEWVKGRMDETLSPLDCETPEDWAELAMMSGHYEALSRALVAPSVPTVEQGEVEEAIKWAESAAASEELASREFASDRYAANAKHLRTLLRTALLARTDAPEKSSEGPIAIEVRRSSDGDVTLLQGDGGIAVAVTLPETLADLAKLEAGLVALRCDNAMEMAVALGSILAAVRAVSPAAYDMARDLERIFDGTDPEHRRVLPTLADPIIAPYTTTPAEREE